MRPKDIKESALAADVVSRARAASPITEAAERIGARPSDIPGLWTAPGYPELTTGQLMSVAGRLVVGGSR